MVKLLTFTKKQKKGVDKTYLDPSSTQVDCWCELQRAMTTSETATL